jgi:hypothetical protein
MEIRQNRQLITYIDPACIGHPDAMHTFATRHCSLCCLPACIRRTAATRSSWDSILIQHCLRLLALHVQAVEFSTVWPLARHVRSCQTSLMVALNLDPSGRAEWYKFLFNKTRDRDKWCMIPIKRVSSIRNMKLFLWTWWSPSAGQGECEKTTDWAAYSRKEYCRPKMHLH